MEAQRLDPRNISIRLAMAAVDLAERRLEDCICRCSEALAVFPGDQGLLHLRGHAYWHKGDLLASLADFSECIAADRRHPAGYRARAAIYKWFGKLRPALADLNAAIRFAPDVAGQYTERAAIHRALGDLEAAAADDRISLLLTSAERRPLPDSPCGESIRIAG